MNRRNPFVYLPAVGAVLLASVSWPAAAQDSKAQVIESYETLPLRFEQALGRAGEPARYLARGPGYTMSLMPSEVLLSLRRAGAPAPGPLASVDQRPTSLSAGVLRIKLLNARKDAPMEGEEELLGKSNYLMGSDPKSWRTGVGAYAKVRCREVYPQTDVVYYGHQRELEYDFVVAPGGDPSRIRLAFEGARSLRLDRDGNLIVKLEAGALTKRAPIVYQEAGTTKQSVHGRWILRGKKEAGFEIGAYDRTRTLVIDPVLVYSTYLGGTRGGHPLRGLDWGYGIAVDSQGNAYVTGCTEAADFPVQNPYQTDADYTYDAFVTKFSPSGGLVYSTYLGGYGVDEARAIAVDDSGSAYVTGLTDSRDFPILNPYQTDQPSRDAFVTKLSPSGDSLVYSTYLGGSDTEEGYGITVDSLGNAYVTGYTWSTDFPIQGPSLSFAAYQDAFVAKLSPSGNALVYSRYLGGGGNDVGQGVAVDASGNAYVTGGTSSNDFPLQHPYQTFQDVVDAFVTKLLPSGSLAYSTYLGGRSWDEGFGIAVDGSGNAYVTGRTNSTGFPTRNPSQTFGGIHDAFVTKLSPSGDSLVYSTYLGGEGFDWGFGIAVDSQGSAYVTGQTDSSRFPFRGHYQTPRPQYPNCAFVTKLSPSGRTLVYSNYLGGNGRDVGQAIAVDRLGRAYVTGYTNSADFPLQSPYQNVRGGDYDAFVTKLERVPVVTTGTSR